MDKEKEPKHMGAFTNQYRPRLHLTVEEAARRFGVSPQTLMIAVRRHKLRARHLAHRTWVTSTAVAQFLAAERQRSALSA